MYENNENILNLRRYMLMILKYDYEKLNYLQVNTAFDNYFHFPGFCQVAGRGRLLIYSRR